jgi:anti-sigma-K factor RskA
MELIALIAMIILGLVAKALWHWNQDRGWSYALIAVTAIVMIVVVVVGLFLVEYSRLNP